MTRKYDKEYYKKYYQEHKQEIIKRNRQWRLDNKERFYELVYKSRKKKAEKLKEQGLDYVWHSKKERERLYEKRNKRISRSIKEKEI